MSSNQTVVVIVPGAWTPPAAYRKLADALKAKSLAVHIPALPTNNGARPPNSSHEADMAAVRDVVEPLVSQGNDVVMLMHSYGGAVGTNAVEGLARTDRQSKGLEGGVVHLVYLSAYLLAKGQSIMTILDLAGLTGRDHLVTINEDGTWLPSDSVSSMYHDLDPDDQVEQSELVKPNNLACMYGQVKYEAWRDIPSTYVRTEQDLVVPPKFQDICLENAEKAGISVNIAVFDCGHSAYAKYPIEVADIVVKASNAT
ncbi:alpha/beta-hydrolase [Hypoxylon rubiginosum]|uniref:Alpha/beta-hydrolase n=1 Tax=Hypoxylon rubiginosum TaxID=110542 RepID=A0ACC0CTU7_9PEZI|nr:alpha/beta-hydrolase [Hypoxylon rubiginosum]